MPTSRFSATLLLLAMLCAGFITAQTKQPSTGASDYQRGITAMEQGDLPTERAAFEKAVQSNPRSADAQNMLGQVLLQQGDVDSTLAHFRTMIKFRPTLALAPTYAQAHYQLGIALNQKGKKEEAQEEFPKAEELDPHLTPPYH